MIFLGELTMECYFIFDSYALYLKDSINNNLKVMILLELIGLIVFTSLFLLIAFIIYSTIIHYRPPKELLLEKNVQSDIIQCDSDISILSWNIGYAGLGSNMNFFFDGGKKSRDVLERTITNLDSINQFLKKNLTHSFMLIQEVDINSKRSHYINQVDIIERRTNYHYSFAYNYVVKFVPIPIYSPMGRVNSGIMILSKYLPKNSIRFSLPGKLVWPIRLFHLRRCMLVNRYTTNNQKEFVLINIHLSLFKDTRLRIRELQFLRDFVMGEYTKGNYVVVGGDWNQFPPKYSLTNFDERKAYFNKFSSNLLPKGWKWAFDPKSSTNRYLNEFYTPGKTTECLIDYFLVSPNVEILQNKTFNLHFNNSDHNPISMKIKLNRTNL